jgi:hypothetical protein
MAFFRNFQISNQKIFLLEDNASENQHTCDEGTLYKQYERIIMNALCSSKKKDLYEI